MKLLHFALAAHVVHQKVRVAFAPNESHNPLLRLPWLFGLSEHIFDVVYMPSTTLTMVGCYGL